MLSNNNWYNGHRTGTFTNTTHKFHNSTKKTICDQTIF